MRYYFIFFLMIRRPPRSTLTDTLFPYTTLFRSGDVLTMASMPSFDPNSFSDGISHLEWDMLSKDDHVPLRNKTLQGLYPPGSTVKPMVALALLEADRKSVVRGRGCPYVVISGVAVSLKKKQNNKHAI